LSLLPDTRVLLWAAGQPDRLTANASALLLDPGNQLYFSSVSLWEIAIKSSLGRPDFSADPRRLWRMLLTNGYRALALVSEHATAVGELPPLHKDPFDRILLAQARVEGLQLVTADDRLAAYGEGARRI
jgi:PIN domain nuclease of toxin-antitoxin system